MRSRRSDLEHQEAVSRRLALLGDELAGVRPARLSPLPTPPSGPQPVAPPLEDEAPQWYDEHTRTAVRREPAPVVPLHPGTAPRSFPAAPPAVATLPVPGRHAARRPGPAAALPGAVADALPGRLGDRLGGLALGAPQVAVVAVLLALGLAVTCWWLVRSDASPAEDELSAAPAVGLVTPSGPAGAAGAAGATGAARSPDEGAVEAGQASAAAGQDAPATVTVDVAGKVRRPGIAVLGAGARVVDALTAAGGARPGVDLTTLNLARVLVDGEQLLVGIDPPTGAAAAAGRPPASGATTGASGTAPVPGALVDLNTATADQLDALPEVGPVTAQAILDWRTEHGSFTSVDELLEVGGIGEVTLAKIAPFVTV